MNFKGNKIERRNNYNIICEEFEIDFVQTYTEKEFDVEFELKNERCMICWEKERLVVLNHQHKIIYCDSCLQTTRFNKCFYCNEYYSTEYKYF